MTTQVVWVFVHSRPLITTILGVYSDPNKVLSSKEYSHIPFKKSVIVMEDDVELNYWSYVKDDWTLQCEYWLLEPCYVE